MSAQRSHTGLSITFGLGTAYLGLLILLPLAVLIAFSTKVGLEGFAEIVQDKLVLTALRFSLGTAAAAAAVNLILGLIIAFTLVRCRFPGKRLIDACIDLPFALPTAVAGIALSYLFSPDGAFGRVISALGFDPVGMDFLAVSTALLFIGLPFVVRSVEPAIRALAPEDTEAARTLGAGTVRIFTQIILPAILPAALTGFALAFARGLGEYGSVIFVSSNLPYESQIVPVVIVGKIEAHDYEGAAAVGVLMLILSFILLFIINQLQRLGRSRSQHGVKQHG